MKTKRMKKAAGFADGRGRLTEVDGLQFTVDSSGQIGKSPHAGRKGSGSDAVH